MWKSHGDSDPEALLESNSGPNHRNEERTRPMAKRYSSPKLPQDLKLDIDDAIALTVGERAAGRIARGAHLTEQLEMGRALWF